MGLWDALRDGALTGAGLLGEILQEAASARLGKSQIGDDGLHRERPQEADGTVSEAMTSPVPDEKAKTDPKSMFWDPFSVVEQLGYKERPASVSYGTLAAIVQRMPVVQSIIQTRVNQVAAFAQPQHDRHQLGFRIGLRDSEAEPMPADRKWMKEMEALILRTGVTSNPRGRQSFEKFLRQVTKDSLTFDQMTFEIVPDRRGRPCEFYATDATTFRLSDDARAFIDEDIDNAVRYVQIFDGLIIAEFTQEELCFGVRNPSSSIRSHGYGTSELEMLVTVITSMLYAWQYNQNFFTQGSAQKGLLNIKGTIPESQLKTFRRHWYQMLSGVENAWRTPIVNAEEIQWVNLQNSNRDMEFSAWMDFQIKVACAMYQMDPIELNFKYGNAGQKSQMNEASNKEKITESKERGLRPLLRFLADCINTHIIWPINENFEFKFVGLDALTRQDVAELNAKRVKTDMTVNELRAEDDKPPLPDGDIILDPTYLAYKNAKMGMQQQQTQNATQGMGPQFQIPASTQAAQPTGSDGAAQVNYETEQPGEGDPYDSTRFQKAIIDIEI